MSEIKNLQEAVAEVKKASKNNPERTLFDDYAIAAMSGLLASNHIKDIGPTSFKIATEMLEARKQFIKG